MAHHRRLVAGALAVNTAIVLVEVGAGLASNSLSLVMDGLHNLSDELALVFLYLAYSASGAVSRNLLRAANILNTGGLIIMSGLMIVYSAFRMVDPQPVIGWVPALVGLAAAAANGVVAKLLHAPSRGHPAARLAYLHNLGDAYVSLAPAAAGALIILLDLPVIDPLLALLVGLWILAGTVRELGQAPADLLWPGRIACGDADGHKT